MIKLLHISDVHLDMPIKSSDSKTRKALYAETLASFERAFNYAIDNGYDFVVIAGDLFDSSNISYKSYSKLLGILDKAKHYGVRTIAVSGNHDYLYEPSLIQKFDLFSQSSTPITKIFTTETGEKTVFSIVGHSGRAETRNLILDMEIKNTNDIWIGVAHAQIAGSINELEKGVYLPTSVSDIISRDYDYFALGHIHKQSMINSRAAYSGSLSPLDRSETGVKGGLSVKIDAGDTKVEFVEFSNIEFIDFEFILENVTGEKFQQLSFIENLIFEKIIDSTKESMIANISIELRSEFDLSEELEDLIRGAVLKKGYIDSNVKVHCRPSVDFSALKETLPFLDEIDQLFSEDFRPDQKTALTVGIPLNVSFDTYREQIENTIMRNYLELRDEQE